MSKWRDRRNRTSREFFNASLDERKLRNSIMGETTRSRFIPDAKGSRPNADLTLHHQDKLFNK